MKKLINIILALALGTASVHAQDRSLATEGGRGLQACDGDDADYSFVTDTGKVRGCAWLSKGRLGFRITKYCSASAHRAACCDTCAVTPAICDKLVGRGRCNKVTCCKWSKNKEKCKPRKDHAGACSVGKPWTPPPTPVPPVAKCASLVASTGNWTTWMGDVATFLPVFRPTSDDELRHIVTSAGEFGCRVRMAGAGHSQDGMVVQRREGSGDDDHGVVVVSLADHSTSVPGWSDHLDAAAATFRIGAGRSWYDVSALLRPRGHVLRSHAALQFFSVGGVIANMVHGSGKDAGFVHDDVTALLAMTADGALVEVDAAEDLRFWRSSAGLLGAIVAVEMRTHAETGGGLVMSRETTAFHATEGGALVGAVAARAHATSAAYATAQFFYDVYGNTLAEYRTSHDGPPFSGATGPHADAAKAAAYAAATAGLAQRFPDVAATGGPILELGEAMLCEMFCFPGTGPGTAEPCDRVPSSMIPGADMCTVPMEASAALSTIQQPALDASWDSSANGPNDGYLILNQTATFDLLISFFPARAFAHAFGAWYATTAGFIQAGLVGAPETSQFFPNGNLEFRFINPTETAVLNPVPTLTELKEDFDATHNQAFGLGPGASAFDLLLPPLPSGVPDGLVAIEVTNLRGVFDDNVSLYLRALQDAWGHLPTNPLVPYGPDVLEECSPSQGVLPCQGVPLPSQRCCNPPVPSVLAHFGKGWGYGVDPETTPVTGKLQPFTDADQVSRVFDAAASKRSSIAEFAAVRARYDPNNVFAGGAMMRWLDADGFPDSDFEPRSLDKQACGSPAYLLDPAAECVGESCLDSVCA